MDVGVFPPLLHADLWRNVVSGEYLSYSLLHSTETDICRGPIPWAMPAEVFPSTIRAKGCAQATMSNWGNNFIIVSPKLPTPLKAIEAHR